MGVEAFEPGGSFGEGRDGGDEGVDADFSGGHEVHGFGVLAGGGAGALQADLAGDDFLEGEGDLGGDVADEGDGSAFADAVDACGDGFVSAYGFEDAVDAAAGGEGEDFFGEGGAGGEEDFVGAESGGEGEAGGVDVGDEDAAGALGLGGLEKEEADHAGSDDEDGFVAGEGGDVDAVEGDGDGFEHGGGFEGEVLWEVVADTGGDGEIFGEGSGAAEVRGGNADDLAVVAEVYLAGEAEGAGAAVDGGVEGDTVADFVAGDLGADGGYGSGGLVAHDDGG